MSRAQVKEHGGPSIPTLRDVEAHTGRTISASTLNKLDVGLGWEPGSAAEVLRGGDPAVKNVGRSAQATLGPDFVPIGIPIVVELLAVSQDLEDLASKHDGIPEIDAISKRVATALHPIYGEYVTSLFEANRREHGALSPVFTVFGRLLEEPNDSLDPAEYEERAYRRWLAGRDQDLTGEQRDRFERRFQGGAH
ncbi:hypothetical protein [Rhodococcus sp. B10]|uniref:hypothetical protein n=1 Tax=Rhodococcus sp. B10 TaxID=2695876 RepID=UPI00143078D8|nr:hypothetical protein [Rhodococcus sp. B10]